MKFRIVENAWWMFWTNGMVFVFWVWFRKGSLSDNGLYRHELEHCYQIKEMGRITFVLTYFLFLCSFGYKKHPYEKAARRESKKALTKAEQNFREKLIIQL